MLRMRVAIAKTNIPIPRLKPIIEATLSLVVREINGTITAAEIPKIGPLKIKTKPSDIAHFPNFVFGIFFPLYSPLIKLNLFVFEKQFANHKDNWKS